MQMKAYEKYISADDVQNIHEKTLYVMQNVGIMIEHDEACSLLESKGARVSGHTVFFTEKMINDALKLAQKTFEIYSSKGNLTIGNGSLIVGPASSNIYIKDDNLIRKATNTDVINQFILSETSPITSISCINFMADTTGFDAGAKKFSGIATLLKYGDKNPMIARPNYFREDVNQVRQIYKEGIEIIKDFEGVDDKIVNIAIINTMSPLCLSGIAVENIYGACAANQGIMLSSCAMPILTGPPTLASLIITSNAEVLAGYVLAKAINPNVAFAYANTSASTSMKTMQIAIGSPEAALIVYATSALADFYNLPFRAGGGLSDSKGCDIQAGVESTIMIQASIDAKTDYIHHGCGTIGQFNIVSFEKFLIDEDIYRYATRIYKGIDCSDAGCDIDDIIKIGPRGTLIKQRTPGSFRKEFVAPEYLNKEDPGSWQANGAKDIVLALKEQVNLRLASYNPPQITNEQNKLLNKYLPDQYKETL